MAKKTFMTDDDAPQTPTAKPTLREVDAAIYGDGVVAIPDSGRQVNKPIALDAITPDPTQPRRAIPFSIRRKAKQDGISEWLAWYQIAERLLGKDIPLKSLLRGEGEGGDMESTGLTLVDDFLDLVTLAASINRDGLANAITVASRGMDHYIIETGERRYQAMRMLYGVLQEERFKKITTRVVEKSSVWAQAAENAQRKPLNAIGIARQLAILIMELNKGKDGISYAPYGDFGETRDREFYAQVANGVVHRIPKGAGEQILQATGLKSRTQLQQYREILSASDELWVQADEENWTEGRIRSLMHPKDMSTTVDISPRDTITARNGMTPRDGHIVGSGQAIVYPLSGEGQKFATYRGQRVQIERSVGMPIKGLRVWLLNGATRTRSLDVEGYELSDITDTLAPTPSQNGPVKVGQRRRSRGGRLYEIISILGTNASCVEIGASGSRTAPFPLALSALAEMPLEVSRDDLRRETNEMLQEAAMLQAAQDAIMGGDDEEGSDDEAPLMPVPDSERPPLPDWAVAGTFVRSIRPHYEHLNGHIESLWWAMGGYWMARVDDHKPGLNSGFASLLSHLVPADEPAALDEAAAIETEIAPLNIYTEIYEHRRSGLLYRIKETRMNGDADVVEVNDDGEEISKYTRCVASLDLKRYIPGTPRLPEPGLIPDTQELMLLSLYRGEPVVKNAAIRGGLEDKGMIIVTDRAGWQAEITESGTAYLLEHHLIAEDVQPAPIDEPDAESASDDELPAWAVWGATVQHTISNQLCDVIGSVRGLLADENGTEFEGWYLRVQIHGGEQADAPLRDFRHVADSPAAPDMVQEKHAALDPKNMLRLICEDQGLINLVTQMAERMGLDRSLSTVLNAAATTTPDGLRKRQQSGGYDVAQAHLDTQRTIIFTVLNEFVRRYNGVYEEECVVNYQIAQGA